MDGQAVRTAAQIPAGLAQMMTARDALRMMKLIEQMRRSPEPPTIDEIVREVAHAFGQDEEKLMRTRERWEPLATARFAAMTLCVELTGQPVGEIARQFGRHHSLPMKAWRRTKDREDVDLNLRGKMAALRVALISKGGSF